MINTKEIAVVGCEHSGTRLITTNLLHHPHVKNEVVSHYPIPGGAGHNPMQQIINRCQFPKYDIRVVFVMRDQTALKHSHKRSFSSFPALWEKWWEEGRPTKGGWACLGDSVEKNWAECFRRMVEVCEKTHTPYSIVSYEAYNLCRVPVVTKMFRDIGIDPTAMNWSKEEPQSFTKRFGWEAGNIYVKPHDGNRKYFDDEKQ